MSLHKVQDAAVSVIPSILDQIPDKIVKEQLLPKVQSIHLTNKADAATSLCIVECNAKVRISYLIGLTKVNWMQVADEDGEK